MNRRTFLGLIPAATLAPPALAQAPVLFSFKIAVELDQPLYYHATVYNLTLGVNESPL